MGTLIKYSQTRMVVTFRPSPRCRFETKINIYLETVLLFYVDKFNYLGHFINDEFSDDEDIDHERRNLTVICNVLIRRCAVCKNEVIEFLTRYKQSKMS